MPRTDDKDLRLKTLVGLQCCLRREYVWIITRLDAQEQRAATSSSCRISTSVKLGQWGMFSATEDVN
jgi:hypothetical protein